MKILKYSQLVAGLGLVLMGAGCVRERVTYVTQVPPVVGTPPPAEPPQPPPAPAPIMRSAAELDRMLAPIALYPDPLTAQILPASTVPDQVSQADQYVRAGRDLNRVDLQAWDESVKTLTRYPDVLRMMGGNIAWTTDLGIAFVNQGGDVMDSIQRLRAQARAIGNLRTTPEQIVVVERTIIQIVPANPQIIYVPVYRPEVVYVRPPPRGGLHIHFSIGLPVGPWLNHDCNWNDRTVIVWHHDHPRPRNWWYEPPSRQPRGPQFDDRGRDRREFTVWRPRNDRDNSQWDRDRDRDRDRADDSRDGRGPRDSGRNPPRTIDRNPRTIPAPKDSPAPPPIVRDEGSQPPTRGGRDTTPLPDRRPAPGQVSDRTDNPPPVVRDNPAPPRQGQPTPPRNAPGGSDVVINPPPSRDVTPTPTPTPPGRTNIQTAPPGRTIPPRVVRREPTTGVTNRTLPHREVRGPAGSRNGSAAPVARETPPTRSPKSEQAKAPAASKDRDPAPPARQIQAAAGSDNSRKDTPAIARDQTDAPTAKPGSRGNALGNGNDSRNAPNASASFSEKGRGKGKSAERKNASKKESDDSTNTVPVNSQAGKSR